MYFECNGLYVEYNFYGNNEYSVQFCGDDLIFETKEEAIEFCKNVDLEG